MIAPDPVPAVPFEANEVLYIKLGERGVWEETCLRDGVLWFGYHEVPHDAAIGGDWDAVRAEIASWKTSQGAKSNHLRQVMSFYEADAATVFITFSGGSMHWCRPGAEITLLPDGSKIRATIDGWHDRSLDGQPLHIERIAGHVATTSAYRQTICATDTAYVLRKIAGTDSPSVRAARDARTAFATAMAALIHELRWQDFELLVELLFTGSGWRRVSATGGTQKTTDIDLVLPSTGERALVQVKSRASQADLNDYLVRFDASTHARLFFVWHTGPALHADRTDVTLIGPSAVAARVVDAGLAQWVIDRLS